MKKILFIFLTTNCFAYPPEIERAQELNQWIHNTIPYVKSPHELKFPADTIRYGGDCADMSRLLIVFLEAEGIVAEMYVMIMTKSQESHAIVQVGNYFFDPTDGNMYEDTFPFLHQIAFIIPSLELLSNRR